MTKAEAARAALAAHDALVATNGREPALLPDGMPRNPEAWLRWNENERRPAYDAWSAAMDVLDVALGERVSRHPFNFRPLCEELVAG